LSDPVSQAHDAIFGSRVGYRELIRSLAKRLAEEDADAARIRSTVSRMIASEPLKKGSILAALRRSPLAEISFDVSRSREAGRKID
jgi:hypothetical protein